MSEALTRCEFQSSELSRNAAAVFYAAEAHPVRVTRRDAEPLILMSERESDARKSLFSLAAQLIGVTTDDRGTLTERMQNQFPWMLALSADDRDECAKELVSAARASFATNQPHLATTTLTSWIETAAALAAGHSARAVEWLDEEVPVKRP